MEEIFNIVLSYFFSYLFIFIKTILSFVLNPIFLIPILIYVLHYVYKLRKYKETTYFKVTNKPYLSVRRDLGIYGEYLIYDYLKEYEQMGARFLFNIYIPRSTEETTEIDVLMITRKGLFVFESKNYSGWIFGSETQKNWYQTLPIGRGRSHKEVFYNPVMQNKTHIKFLKSLIGNDIFTYSIIAFSDRCELKKIRIKSDNLSIVNRYMIKKIVPYVYDELENILTDDQVSDLYNKLYPYTQVTPEIKQKHIDDIHNEFDSISRIAISTDITKFEDNRCPRCGAELLKKNGRYGEFIGCSNYPKCRFIKK